MRKDTRVLYVERDWKIGSYPVEYRGGYAFTVPNLYDTQCGDEIPVRITIEEVDPGRWHNPKEKVKNGKVV